MPNMIMKETFTAMLIDKFGRPGISFQELVRRVKLCEKALKLNLWPNESDVYYSIIALRDNGFILWDKKRKIVQPLPTLTEFINNNVRILEVLNRDSLEAFKKFINEMK